MPETINVEVKAVGRADRSVSVAPPAVRSNVSPTIVQLGPSSTVVAPNTSVPFKRSPKPVFSASVALASVPPVSLSSSLK